MKAAILMVLYAGGLLFTGVVAFLLAPEGANAVTAVIVTGAMALVMLVCAVLSLRIKTSRKQGMIGIHLGLVLPLVFALAVMTRASAATNASNDYRESRSEFDKKVDAGELEGSRSAFRQFLVKEKYADELDRGKIDGDETTLADFREKPGKLNDHDKAYQAAALWSIVGWSVFAFFALLLHRPKPGPKASAEEPVETEE